MTRWTRRQTWPDEPNDWCVLRDGVVVDCVYDGLVDRGSGRWIWAAQVGQVANGHAANNEDAFDAVRSRAGSYPDL